MIENVKPEATPNDFTPNEPWASLRTRGHQYDAQADYVSEMLGDGPGKCLVVGSPLFELFELARTWDTTYVDLRNPPQGIPGEFIQGDAAQMDFGVEKYDAASSTCVLCHAGTGRYGDERNEFADAAILRNVNRALKRGARFAVMFGPCFALAHTVRRNWTHKVYSIRDAMLMTEGFVVLSLCLFNIERSCWTHHINFGKCLDADYLSMTLVKI